jgi:hypothetical protein
VIAVRDGQRYQQAIAQQLLDLLAEPEPSSTG